MPKGWQIFPSAPYLIRRSAPGHWIVYRRCSWAGNGWPYEYMITLRSWQKAVAFVGVVA
jgi:hypothetical protein